MEKRLVGKIIKTGLVFWIMREFLYLLSMISARLMFISFDEQLGKAVGWIIQIFLFLWLLKKMPSSVQISSFRKERFSQRCKEVLMAFAPEAIVVLVIFVAVGLFVLFNPSVLDDVSSIESRSIGYALLIEGLLIPIVEELQFRGYLFEKMKVYGIRFAVIGVSVCFALIHLSVLKLIPVFISSIISCLLRVKYNDLISCITVHILNNSILVLMEWNDFFLIPAVLIYLTGLVLAVKNYQSLKSEIRALLHEKTADC